MNVHSIIHQALILFGNRRAADQGLLGEKQSGRSLSHSVNLRLTSATTSFSSAALQLLPQRLN
jgi:hypothetical protein